MLLEKLYDAFSRMGLTSAFSDDEIENMAIRSAELMLEKIDEEQFVNWLYNNVPAYNPNMSDDYPYVDVIFYRGLIDIRLVTSTPSATYDYSLSTDDTGVDGIHHLTNEEFESFRVVLRDIFNALIYEIYENGDGIANADAYVSDIPDYLAPSAIANTVAQISYTVRDNIACSMFSEEEKEIAYIVMDAFDSFMQSAEYIGPRVYWIMHSRTGVKVRHIGNNSYVLIEQVARAGFDGILDISNEFNLFGVTGDFESIIKQLGRNIEETTAYYTKGWDWNRINLRPEDDNAYIGEVELIPGRSGIYSSNVYY